MNQRSSIFRVFVSSTSEDLRDYRAVARNMILKMGWYPEMMEYFGACPNSTVNVCHEKLKKCDLVLLIIAFKRGWIPSKEQGGNGNDSITALELLYAREHHIPVLAMLASTMWPGNLWENDDAEARTWVKKFRDNLNLPVEFFDYELSTGPDSERLPAFRAKVEEVLLSHREDLLAKESVRQETVSHLDYFESACQDIIEGSTIPFLGHGIYGEGPLSTQAFIDALQVKNCGEHWCLATAAEYCERYRRKREIFLARLRKVIEEQSLQRPVSAVHDMIFQGEAPLLIVSATYDHLLEDRLEAEGRAYVVVSHIISSLEGEHNGKILLLRKDDPPKILLSDKIDLKGDGLIIYKPLGSPLLNAKLDPELEIDTVVITETDHLTFLGRLENQNTQIPTVFSRLFQRYSLTFIGYTLDVWHYRLVMQVFQQVGAGGKLPTIKAVRQPSSEMEELVWKRLGADLIRMDPNEFALQVCSNLNKGK